jgi:hypothetical protein
VFLQHAATIALFLCSDIDPSQNKRSEITPTNILVVLKKKSVALAR